MEEPMKQPAKRPEWLGKAIVGAVIALLLIAIAVLVWQLKVCLDKDAKTAQEKQALQAQVAQLNQQLAAAQTSDSSSTSSSASTCSAQTTITQTLKDNLAAAIESGNTAALKGYMADEVNVVFAASEKAGKESPDAAIGDLQYLSSATAPWDFNLPAATLDGFKAGDYKQYFDGEIYVGESSDDYVIAYHFDTCGKIDQLFLAANADLLT